MRAYFKQCARLPSARQAEIVRSLGRDVETVPDTPDVLLAIYLQQARTVHHHEGLVLDFVEVGRTAPAWRYVEPFRRIQVAMDNPIFAAPCFLNGLHLAYPARAGATLGELLNDGIRMSP